MTSKAMVLWAGCRALAEEFGVPLGPIAEATGRTPASLRRRAARDGWKLSGAEAGLSRPERIARLHDNLLDRIERLQLDADREPQKMDKAGIAELSSTVRMLAKIGGEEQDEDDARERQMIRDADIAAILDRLDARIVELARHLAQTLAGDEFFARGASAAQP